MKSGCLPKYKAILFDFDGTLMDTSPGVISSMRRTLNYLGLPNESDETIKRFIGPPAGAIFREKYGFSEIDARRASNIFRKYYEQGDFLNAIPYFGINIILSQLQQQGFLLAVATNKHLNQTQETLKHFDFDQYFIAVAGADDSFKLTKADIICDALSKLNICAGEAVLVGDSKFDAKGAEMAGVDFIAVCYGIGFCTSEEVSVYPNSGCVSSTEELAALWNISLK